MNIFKNIRMDLGYLKYAKEFEREYIRINYERAIPIITLLYFVEWFIFLYEDKFMNVGNIVFVFQIFSTIIIPIIYYFYKNFDSISNIKLRILLYIYVFSFLFFGIALVFGTQEKADLLHMFMMIILAVGSFFFLTPKESFVIIGMSSLVFSVGISFFQKNPEVVNVDRLNSILFNGIVWLLSCNIFLIKIRDLYLQKELELSNNQLLKLSKLDQMTGINNHESIINALAQEMERAKRYDEDLTIMLLDIDDFKRVNDNFGHLIGDKVIIKLSNMMKETIRLTDQIGRYGGEEFLIIMPNTNIESALYLFKRIRELLETNSLIEQTKITVSAGIAMYNDEDINDIIKTADNRLYVAKATGKDRCVGE